MDTAALAVTATDVGWLVDADLSADVASWVDADSPVDADSRVGMEADAAK